MQLFKHFTANNIQLEPYPFRRELSMESYLIDNEGVLALDDDVFSNVEVLEAELTLKQGRTSKDTDGRIDILATYSQEYIGIIELKLGQLEEIHLSQLEDYLKEKERLIREYPEVLGEELVEQPKWLGVLIGTSLNPQLADKINQGYKTDDGVQIAALTIQRYRSSDGQIYVVTETFFDAKTSSRDHTKYSFNGQKNLGKAKLVLEVIRHYVQNHPSLSYSDLEKTFPKHLQGSYGVFVTVEQANEIYSRTKKKRHYLKPEEQIKLSDCVIIVFLHQHILTKTD